MEYFVLNNGVKMPTIGTGTNTFGKPNDDYEAAPNGDFTPVDSAIAAGYRLFDTAIAYGNEEGIGKALAECGVPRENLFITSKLPSRDPYTTSTDSVRKSVEESLRHMRTDHYDLFMIHRPFEDRQLMLRVWKDLEALLKEGKFRAIGVSNFGVEDLQVLLDGGSVVPAVNQVRRNPDIWNQEVIAFCKANGIQPMAHSPLNFKNADYKQTLADVGGQYHKSWAQVLLRLNYECGICCIPKSSNPKNQAANLEIFDFSLTKDDLARLQIQK